MSVLVHQNTVRGPFQIVELPAAQRPPEHGADRKDEHQAQRHQQINDIHVRLARVHRQRRWHSHRRGRVTQKPQGIRHDQR